MDTIVKKNSSTKDIVLGAEKRFMLKELFRSERMQWGFIVCFADLRRESIQEKSNKKSEYLGPRLSVQCFEFSFFTNLIFSQFCS